MFWDFLSTYKMKTKPRNPKVLKMEQSHVKAYLASTRTKFVQVRRDWANKNAEFPQLVSAMTLPSEECLKFAQVALLYKLDVIYSNYIFSDICVPSAEKITLVDMYRKSRYKDFLLLVGKIELHIQTVCVQSF